MSATLVLYLVSTFPKGTFFQGYLASVFLCYFPFEMISATATVVPITSVQITHRCIYLAVTFRKPRDPDSDSCCLLCFATWLSFWWLKLDIHRLWITTVASPTVSFLTLPLQKAINLLISGTNAGWFLRTLTRVRNRVNWCLLQVQSLT